MVHKVTLALGPPAAGIFYPKRQVLYMTIGVDVSKDSLVAGTPDGQTFAVPNSLKGVNKLLSTLKPRATVCMEATGKLHKLLADTAFERNFTVFVFNPKDVLHYARSISPRAKTDRVDAHVIARFAMAKDHHPYRPTPQAVTRLKMLIGTRAALARERVSHENRLREHPLADS